ncbi:hypothetical protein DNTS_009160 [Danionella cerebrum]|uniref:SH2 domain-containing protein n=1 Tax=Danionella cerebrum TaxID=2873325 RepID=A0A553QAW3_9TELE|nr:hypothetical protein DNTS_009160 [Danionella translucida]
MMMAVFTQEVLPGRNFTFWQWFEGVMDLTKKCLRDYWTDGLIFGFIGKQHIHVILQSKPSGTFLLRFSDSEMGGISIAYVGPTENGGRRIQNIQPFTKKDLDKRGLGDQLRDISCISHVYPDLAKNEVFKKYFTETPPNPDGYVPFKVKTVVNPDDMSSQSLPVTDPMNVFQPISSTYGQPMNEDMFRQYPHCTPPYMPETPMSQTIFSLTAPQANPIESLDMDDIAGILQSI